MTFLRFIGTDISDFAQMFPRMRVGRGGFPPAGERGFMFANQVSEDQLKLKIAKRLDEIRHARQAHETTIAANQYCNP